MFHYLYLLCNSICWSYHRCF